MAQRKKAASFLDAAAIEAEVREALSRDGAVKLSSVKPAALRSRIAESLSLDGFEVTKAAIRRPLPAQLLQALAHGALVPLKSLATHVQGATAGELKLLIADALHQGLARRVLRGTTEVLVGTDHKVLSPAEVNAIRLKLVALGKTLEKVTKKPGLSLLATDVAAALDDATTAMNARAGMKVAPSLATQRKPVDDALAALLEAVDSTRDERTGLSFVPAVVGRLAPRVEATGAVKLLVSAAERELLELRPEGGIGRLSEAELSVCPVGPHGTRLSWARRLAGGVP